MLQCRAAIGPGATCQRFGAGVVDLDAGLAQHRHRHRDVRRRRHRLAGVHDRQPVGERRPGQQQTGDELRRRRRVDLDRPAGHRTGAAHRERQRVAVDVDAEAAQRVEQRRDGTGPGLLVAVERSPSRCSAPPPAERTAARCRPGRSRLARPAAGRCAPLTVSSVSIAVDRRRPACCTAPIIRSVSRLRSAPLMVDVPCPGAASAASTSARLVSDFEPGTVTVACTGRDVDGACQVASRPPSCPVGSACQPWDVCVGDSR